MAGRNYRSSRDDDNESTTVTVYVGNLSYDTTQETLMEEFPGCVSVNIPTDRDSGKPRGFAFLEYKDKSAAQEAIQNDRMELDGRTLSINFAKPRGSSRGGGGGARRGGGGYGGGGYGGDRGYRGGRGGDRGYRGGRGYGDDGSYGGGRDRGYGSSRGYGRERDDGYY